MEQSIPVLASLVVTWVVWKYSGKSRTTNLLLLGLLGLVVFGLTACSGGEVQTLDEIGTTVAGLVPMAGSLASVLFPAEAAAINVAVPMVTNGIEEAKKLVNDYHSNPGDTTLQKVTAGFADVHQNLAGLESAVKVNDPTTQKKMGAVVGTAFAILSSLEANIFGKHPAVVAAKAAQTS